MRRHGFDVDVVVNATKVDMARAVERLKSRIKPGSVVLLFFGGYGVQSRHLHDTDRCSDLEGK
jgi:hypothetical protein